MGTLMCSYNPVINKEIEYVDNTTTTNNKTKYGKDDMLKGYDSYLEIFFFKFSENKNKFFENDFCSPHNKYNFQNSQSNITNKSCTLGITKEDLKRNLIKNRLIPSNFQKNNFNDNKNYFSQNILVNNSNEIKNNFQFNEKYLDLKNISSPKYNKNNNNITLENLNNDENLDFYNIFDPNKINKIVLAKPIKKSDNTNSNRSSSNNFYNSNKNNSDQEPEGNINKLLINSRGFDEENKFRRKLSRKNVKFEEEERNSSQLNSKYKSEESKNNKRNNNINNNFNTNSSSIFNFMDNNTFVKLNKNKLKTSPNKKDLVVPLIRQKTSIKKELIFNNNQLILNYRRIIELNQENVIYDLEFEKLNIIKGEYKPARKYCQITKEFFKYYNSIYSSTVWKDKPLLRLPLNNIEKMVLCQNLKTKKKNLSNINVIVQIFLIFNESKFCLYFILKDFEYDTKYEITKQINENSVDYLIELGLESQEEALSLIKIIYFVRKVINKELLTKNDENL